MGLRGTENKVADGLRHRKKRRGGWSLQSANREKEKFLTFRKGIKIKNQRAKKNRRGKEK
jgi:hypothetical protein